MPIPSLERVSKLVADPVTRRGFDLEDVAVVAAGKHSTVRVTVDSDSGVTLDDIAGLTRDISEALDEITDTGEAPYTLEVTTPGIGRPLTLERHWRRARGRKVKIETPTEKFVGRIGEAKDGGVAIVVPGREPTLRTVSLDDVTKAVVEVEFSPPNPRELELAGGIAPGRPVPGAEVEPIEVEESDK
ncbi:ribosome maturation factor RimP [Antrihabitans sp. YC2-6]|uniref:ribosome maturation factor RimP n=1 Tax=Antrihabitans sp. YC2-6 TaxID=2799498 RepID=UPI0018F3D993|nr:ribosome maturation factor RimP [Antrihabitans sp. YC2-6]MBJ8344960.1 ribosome maturation factor RimP [Antrihabitans sp. YC2-6]